MSATVKWFLKKVMNLEKGQGWNSSRKLIDYFHLVDEDLGDVIESADELIHEEKRQEESGSEQSEGKLYFLTAFGQDEDNQSTGLIRGGGGGGGGGSSSSSSSSKQHQQQQQTNSDVKVKKKKNRRNLNRRGDLLRALNMAWQKERNNGRATIRKTVLPVSCPVCFKVLSNAYNLKVNPRTNERMKWMLQLNNVTKPFQFNLNYMQVHMSIHDGLNHQCSICGHTSKSRDALRKHLAYRHLIGQSGPVINQIQIHQTPNWNDFIVARSDHVCPVRDAPWTKPTIRCWVLGPPKMLTKPVSRPKTPITTKYCMRKTIIKSFDFQSTCAQFT